jgi:hypothetical protein
VDLVEPEAAANALQLLDERLDRPERRIVRPIRLSAPELVVEDDAPPLLGERPEPLERVVRAPGPAVQAKQRQAPRLLPVAVDAVPGLVAAEWDAPVQGRR